MTISDDFKIIDIEKISGSDTQVDMVKSLMEIFNENINQYNILVDNLDKLSLNSKEKGKLINELLFKLQENSEKPLIKEQLLEEYKTLGVREYYTISMFSFTSIMFVVVLIKQFYKEKKQGVIRRSFSTPNNEISYLLGYLTSGFILDFITNIIYVVINRALGVAFTDNFIGNSIIILLQSFLQTFVVGIIIATIRSEKIANSIINKMILREELKSSRNDISLEALNYEKTNIKVIGRDEKTISDVIILNMTISFILFGSIGISMELFELKRQNILKRSFATSNKPKTIIRGILVALFLISSLGYSGIFLLNSFINLDSGLNKAPIIILNIIFLVLLALSLGVFITRIIKNKNLIAMVLQIIITFTCFIGGSFMPIEFLPKGIKVFSKFTPQYWALQSINTGNVWMAFIVVLFALVFFTAGTFKVRSFID